MKTGSYTILNYKVDEPGKGGKIHFFTTASRSDDGGGREETHEYVVYRIAIKQTGDELGPDVRRSRSSPL